MLMYGVDVQQQSLRMHARHKTWPRADAVLSRRKWNKEWNREVRSEGNRAASPPPADQGYTHKSMLVPHSKDHDSRDQQARVPRYDPLLPQNSPRYAPSSPDDKATVTSPMQPIFGPVSGIAPLELWMSAQLQIAPLREHIFTMRIRVEHERDHCRKQETLFESILDKFMELLETARAQDSYLRFKEDLDKLLLRMKALRAEVKNLQDRTSRVERALSDQEHQLAMLEQQVYRDLDRERSFSMPQSIPYIHPESAVTALQSSGLNSAAEELRHNLYIRMGEVRIHLERLHNFEYDLREELDERDILREAGQTEISNDTQFFQEIRAERLAIQRDLEAAQEDVARLKNQCIREGIPFEEPQLPDMLYHNGTESFDTASVDHRSESQLPVASSGIIGAFFNAQERVKRWLGDPPHSTLPNKQDTDEMDEEQFGPKPGSDYDLVEPPSLPPTRRQSLTRSLEEYGPAHSTPKWNSGPPPGSKLIEALLLESTSTPLSRHALPAQGQHIDQV